MTKSTVMVATGVAFFAALFSLSRGARQVHNETDDVRIPLWTVAGAAVLAAAIMALVLPQITASGVTFSDVIFDHSKVAMIDDMARLGVQADPPS